MPENNIEPRPRALQESWTPTMHLRFVTRRITSRMYCDRYVQILQQYWSYVGRPDGGTDGEWRDVPEERE
jgi:hypothetical protein